MGTKELIEAAFCSGYEPSSDNMSKEQMIDDAMKWLTDLSR
jgi:hypothetical protein